MMLQFPKRINPHKTTPKPRPVPYLPPPDVLARHSRGAGSPDPGGKWCKISHCLESLGKRQNASGNDNFVTL